MTNAIQNFNFNSNTIRVIERDGDPWWVAKDICDYFGDTNRNRTMQALDEDEKGYTQMTTPGGMQSMAIINEAGLYTMLFAMQPEKGRGVSDEYIAERQEKIKTFKRWITHEVIPAIRKTGSYSVSPTTDKRLEIMDKNADTRRAKVMLDMMKAFKDRMTPESCQVFMVKCGEMITGQDMADLLPGARGKWYSATQIGKMFGVSANLIGRAAKEHSLKAPEGQSNEFGTWKRSKSQHSNTEVLTWVYTDAAIEWFKNYFCGGERIEI